MCTQACFTSYINASHGARVLVCAQPQGRAGRRRGGGREVPVYRSTRTHLPAAAVGPRAVAVIGAGAGFKSAPSSHWRWGHFNAQRTGESRSTPGEAAGVRAICRQSSRKSCGALAAPDCRCRLRGEAHRPGHCRCCGFDFSISLNFYEITIVIMDKSISLIEPSVLAVFITCQGSGLRRGVGSTGKTSRFCLAESHGPGLKP